MNYKVLGIASATAPCANHCRYCLVGAKRYQDVPFHKIRSLALRFFHWQQGQPEDTRMQVTVGHHYAYNTSLRRLAELLALRETLGHSARGCHFILLNGIHFMPEDEWRDWLEERRNLGVSGAGVTLSANQEIHDRWAGRPGEFAFLFSPRLPAVPTPTLSHARILDRLAQHVSDQPSQPLGDPGGHPRHQQGQRQGNGLFRSGGSRSTVGRRTASAFLFLAGVPGRPRRCPGPGEPGPGQVNAPTGGTAPARPWRPALRDW